MLYIILKGRSCNPHRYITEQGIGRDPGSPGRSLCSTLSRVPFSEKTPSISKGVTLHRHLLVTRRRRIQLEGGAWAPLHLVSIFLMKKLSFHKVSILPCHLLMTGTLSREEPWFLSAWSPFIKKKSKFFSSMQNTSSFLVTRMLEFLTAVELRACSFEESINFEQDLLKGKHTRTPS